MPSNILSPHEIQQLIDKLEQQAIEAETKAIAKKHVNHFDAQTEYLALASTAALLRTQIQELTTAELLAAGRTELALRLRQRLQKPLENRKAGHRLWAAKKHIKPKNRFITP